MEMQPAPRTVCGWVSLHGMLRITGQTTGAVAVEGGVQGAAAGLSSLTARRGGSICAASRARWGCQSGRAGA